MRKVIVHNSMSLNGVYQGPFYVDEDTDGGFGHGGWANPYLADIAAGWFIDNERLVDTKATTTGATIATYALARG